jgi:hypothetical protein
LITLLWLAAAAAQTCLVVAAQAVSALAPDFCWITAQHTQSPLALVVLAEQPLAASPLTARPVQTQCSQLSQPQAGVTAGLTQWALLAALAVAVATGPQVDVQGVQATHQAQRLLRVPTAAVVPVKTQALAVAVAQVLLAVTEALVVVAQVAQGLRPRLLALQ